MGMGRWGMTCWMHKVTNAGLASVSRQQGSGAGLFSRIIKQVVNIAASCRWPENAASSRDAMATMGVPEAMAMAWAMICPLPPLAIPSPIEWMGCAVLLI